MKTLIKILKHSEKPNNYNSYVALIGCYLFTDSWSHFFGLVCILESLHITIEQCWPTKEGATWDKESGT